MTPHRARRHALAALGLGRLLQARPTRPHARCPRGGGRSTSLRSIEARAARSARRPRAEARGPGSLASSQRDLIDTIDLIASACTPRYQVFGAYKNREEAGAQRRFLT
jgi:hypothetical protein